MPISQPDRFEVGQLQLSSESIMVGETGSVTLSYVNKGKNAIGNLEARLTGTNLGGENYQYLGNLNAGTEGSVDFDITPDAARQHLRRYYPELRGCQRQPAHHQQRFYRYSGRNELR